jgi:hypothetical protein
MELRFAIRLVLYKRYLSFYGSGQNPQEFP